MSIHFLFLCYTIQRRGEIIMATLKNILSYEFASQSWKHFMLNRIVALGRDLLGVLKLGLVVALIMVFSTLF